MALFILMDEHPQSMQDHIKVLVDNRGPHVSVFIERSQQLANET